MESFDNILNMPPEQLAGWLCAFLEPIPFDKIEGQNELNEAGRLTRKFANEIMYLTELYNYAQLKVRAMKASNVQNKKTVDNLVDARDNIGRVTDAVKILLRAVSRMITIRDDIRQELNDTKWVE